MKLSMPVFHRKYLRSAGIVLVTLGVGLALAGCGSAATQANGSSSTTPSSTTAGSKNSASTVVAVGTARVSGDNETVLQSNSGYTLYYFTKDSASVSHCTGGCSAIWHPVVTSAQHISKPSGLSGTLTVVSDVHGRQIAYNGHLLYVYSGDHRPGQANGQGLLKEWWVATPSLSPLSSVSTSSTASSGSGWNG